MTFRANGDGSYHWESTALVQEGLQVSENLFPENLGKEDSDLSTNPETDVTSDTVTSDAVSDDPTDTVTEGPGTESITDSSAGVTSDVGVVEESTSYTWIYISVGAVVIVSAAAVFFVLKKKKT